MHVSEASRSLSHNNHPLVFAAKILKGYRSVEMLIEGIKMSWRFQTILSKAHLHFIVLYIYEDSVCVEKARILCYT